MSGRLSIEDSTATVLSGLFYQSVHNWAVESNRKMWKRQMRTCGLDLEYILRKCLAPKESIHFVDTGLNLPSDSSVFHMDLQHRNPT